MARGSRLRLASTAVVLMLGGTIGGFEYRAYVDYLDITHSNNLVLQSRIESQKRESQIADQRATLGALQGKLTSVQAALDAIMPSENTYNIDPNQSMIVAGGHLTVGLIGSPTNEGVIINVNGKQHSAAAGGVINIALDSSTTCQVGVQSFDMFKAVLTASCAAVKPH
jgi:hypothetical protein